jgi:hypothetical protein
MSNRCVIRVPQCKMTTNADVRRISRYVVASESVNCVRILAGRFSDFMSAGVLGTKVSRYGDFCPSDGREKAAAAPPDSALM